MNIYVAAATIIEIEPLLEQMSSSQFKILVTGIGAVQTTFHLTRLFETEKPDLIIQAGIAGSFSEDYGPGQVVSVHKDRFADLGAQESGKWLDIYDQQLANPHESPFEDGWLINNNVLLANLDLPSVNSLTVNEITTDTNRINQYISKYQPAIESMEGAAFHFTCLQYKIPFLQIRAVSNLAGERNKKNWQMTTAIENLNKQIFELIKSTHTS